MVACSLVSRLTPYPKGDSKPSFYAIASPPPSSSSTPTSNELTFLVKESANNAFLTALQKGANIDISLPLGCLPLSSSFHTSFLHSRSPFLSMYITERASRSSSTWTTTRGTSPPLTSFSSLVDLDWLPSPLPSIVASWRLRLQARLLCTFLRLENRNYQYIKQCGTCLSTSAPQSFTSARRLPPTFHSGMPLPSLPPVLFPWLTTRTARSHRYAEWAEKGVKVQPVLSRPKENGEEWSGATGYIQDLLKETGVRTPVNSAALLCGMR